MTVGVEDVKAVRHGVVRGPRDCDAGLRQRRERGAQLVVALADLQPEVVHPDAASAGRRGRVGADLDRQ